MRPVDLAVVGGGVIGCSAAYHAARRGARVVLLEAERLGAGASGAAAGMLNAQAEARGEDAFLRLLLKGRERHRSFAEELRDAGGPDPEYVWEGTLRVATEERFAAELRRTYSWQREAGLPARWLSGEEARELEPNLSRGALAALYLPEDGQVNSPRLVHALAQAGARLGVRFLEAARVTGFAVAGERVTGVRTARGEEVSAGCVVLAGGAASALLAGELGLRLPVSPVKGEIISVAALPAPVTANVWDDRCYLVPKRDGRVVIGATQEPGVYDRRPTLGGVAALSGAAVGLVPALSGAPFLNAWGGLRPGTPDGRPVLGPAGGWEGLLIATGHHRNGVLLAPITGEIVASLALGERPPVDIAPFSYERALQTAAR